MLAIHSDRSRAYCRVVRASAWPPASEDWLTELSICSLQIVVESLPHLLRQLKFYGMASLLLANCRPINGIATWCNIINFDGDHVAASELAVDGEIEEGQVALSALDLKPRSDGPDMLCS